MKKTTITTFFLLAALAVSGCQNNQPAPQPQPQEEDPAPPVVSTIQPPQYYFIRNDFVGSFDAEGWHSISDVQEVLRASGEEEQPITPRKVFTAGEVTNVEAYQLYSLDKFLGSTSEIIWPTEAGGLGSFGFDSDTELTDDMAAALQELAQPVTDEATKNPQPGWGRIALPANFADSPLADLTIPYYNANGYFSLNEAINFSDYPVRLATSAQHNPLPQKVQVLYQLSDELEAHFSQELAAMGIPDAPVNLTDYYAADFDHDGLEESLLILQTATTENDSLLVTEEEQLGRSGAYCLVAYIDDQEAAPEQVPQTLYSWSNPYTADALSELMPKNELVSVDYYRHLTFLGAYDLNGDSTLEFCLSDSQWEGGALRVYSLDENDQYRTVLLSLYGS